MRFGLGTTKRHGSDDTGPSQRFGNSSHTDSRHDGWLWDWCHPEMLSSWPVLFELPTKNKEFVEMNAQQATFMNWPKLKKAMLATKVESFVFVQRQNKKPFPMESLGDPSTTNLPRVLVILRSGSQPSRLTVQLTIYWQGPATRNAKVHWYAVPRPFCWHSSMCGTVSGQGTASMQFGNNWTNLSSPLIRARLANSWFSCWSRVWFDLWSGSRWSQKGYWCWFDVDGSCDEDGCCCISASLW